nr:hypothetical protein [Brevundimonas naejangsanensis]
MTMPYRLTISMAALALGLAASACDAEAPRPAPDAAPDAASAALVAPNRRDAQPAACPATDGSGPDPYAPSPDRDPVSQAQDLVREVYERQFQSENSSLPSAFDPSTACRYFTDDIVRWLASGEVDAHPLYGAQDFDGAVGDPTPDPDHPMLRGMITINVDFTNFGQPQRAVFHIRADADKPDAPLRIFRVEHDGGSYP